MYMNKGVILGLIVPVLLSCRASTPDEVEQIVRRQHVVFTAPPVRTPSAFSVDGVVSYVDMPKPAPTGIRMFDAYIRYLADGTSDLQAFADAHGLRREDIDSMIFILTGMRGVDFRLKFQLRMAAELLRYTSMSLAEVSLRSGIGSTNNLYLTFKRDFNLAPGYWRLRNRQQGDVGRYKL